MTSPAATDVISHQLLQLDEALNRLGLRTLSSGTAPTEWRWQGHAGASGEPMIITLDSAFPYSPPKVVLEARAGNHDWHQDQRGELCLWDRHAQGDLPWLDAQQVLTRVEEWVDNANRGWPADVPQLDLEAYSDPKLIPRRGHLVRPLIVIDRWTSVANHWFTASRPDERGCIHVQTATPPPPKPRTKSKGKPLSSHQLLGLAIELGEISAPFFTIHELFSELGSDAHRVEQYLAAGRDVVVAARYQRCGHTGFTGFWLWQDDRTNRYGHVAVVEEESSQRLRAGWHAGTITDRTVSVVGAGSLGSYVADILARSGVRHLVVHDDDRLLPGNLVRHATAEAPIGENKAVAVATVLNARTHDHTADARPAVRTLEDAMALLGEQDLLIDCTGDRLTFQLFEEAARLTGQRFLHVAVVGHGQYARIDICPPLAGADPIPAETTEPTGPLDFEGGCGDPISPTPPAAVVETAAIGARLAIQLLTGEAVAPAGESRHLFAAMP